MDSLGEASVKLEDAPLMHSAAMLRHVSDSTANLCLSLSYPTDELREELCRIFRANQ
jgi:hypothetical protein